ncbi:MAG: hypothetical protein M0R37_15490, partial [Bacteroidales bacterium]|nr:hypothetical protein [Bacteroidales bacterium]
FTAGSTATSIWQASFNVFIGYQAGKSLTTGSGNFIAGNQAGVALTGGDDNVGLGSSALGSLSNGTRNLALGAQSLASFTGNYATSVGAYSSTNVTGEGNTVIGYQAGRYHANGTDLLTTAANSVYIGREARAFNSSDANSVVIGGYDASNATVGEGANTTVIGNAATTLTHLYGNLNIASETIARTTVGPALTVTSSATTYTNGGGTVEFGRTGNLTGVAGETFNNVKIAPVFKVTKPASGDFLPRGLLIDTTGVSYSGSGGTALTRALEIISGVGSSDGYGIYVLGRLNRIESGKSDGSNLIINDSISTGTALWAQSSSVNATSGNVFRASKTGTSGTTAFTGSVANVSWTHNHNAAATLDHTAKGLDVSRAITSNHASAAITVSGALADLNSTNVQTLGTLTDTGNILKLTQGYASASGDVISIANSGTGKDISGTGSKWSVSKTGDLTLQGSMTRNVTAVAAATYDLVATDDILDVTYTSTAAVTSLTLPTAQMVKGRTIVIKDGGGLSGTNNVTIDTEGAEQIDGADTYVLNTNWEAVTLTVNAAGTGWRVISTY